MDNGFEITEDEKHQAFANIIRFLADGGDMTAARVFLSCSMDIEYLIAHDSDYDRPFLTGDVDLNLAHEAKQSYPRSIRE